MQGEKEEVPMLQMSLVDPAGERYTLRLSPSDSPIEIKSCLADFAPTCLYTHFHFETSGQPLNDYLELCQQQVENESILLMVLDSYNERAIKQHVRKLEEVLVHPPSNLSPIVLNQKTETYDLFEAGPDTSLKPLDYSQLVPSPSVLKNPNSQIPPLNAEDQPKNKPQCLHSIAFSEFNPPSAKRRLRGDIAYLAVHTLEGHKFHITACPSGFYLNGTTREGDLVHFDPSPSVERQVSGKTLVDVLNELSPLFKNSFSELLESGVEWDTLSNMKMVQENTWWLGKEQDIEQPFPELEAIRDWNEELQMVRSLPAETPIQKIQKDKAMAKIYYDFLEAAIEGAKLVVRGALQPLNPMDQPKQHIFVLNHIFFSFTEDREYTQEQGPDACTTHVSANHDLRSLRFLTTMDIPDLYSIATAIVDYRGFRILCQSIIPGILSQTPENSAKYGSIDDGQTINTDPEFHELMKQVCDKLHISGSNLLDKDGKAHFLYGALDSKGIRGSDSRKYFLEFLRHTPRDTNLLGSEYSLCLVRPELIDLYTQTKKTEHIEAQVEAELNKKKTETGEDAKLSLEELQNIVQNAPKLAFNPNAFTNAEFAEGEEEAKKSVLELGEYLRNKQIPLVAQVLSNEEGIWARMGNSLVQVFHKFGVNARYLGTVAAAIQAPQHKSVRWMVERHAVARSVKHVFNAEISNISDTYLAETVSHLLNCLFGLSSYKAEESKDNKRKRRGKKIKRRVQEVPVPVPVKVNLLDIHKPESLLHTSATLWRKIQAFAKRHFSLDLPDNFESWEAVSTSGLRLALLRDICLQTGLILESTFTWGQSFTEDLISGLGVKIKALDWRSLESRWLHDSAIKTLNEQNMEIGLEMLQQSASIQSQVSGPLHVDIAITYQRLSNIYLSQGDYIQAISYQHRAIVILERVLGPDHTLVGHHYNNFAYLYQILGKYQRALKHYLYALQIFLVNNGELNPEVLSVLTSISLLYGELGHNDTAITVLNQVLEMSTAMYGETSKTADYCQLLAAKHKQIKNMNRAKNYQTQALEILKTCYGEEDSRVKACQASLESLDQLEASAELPIPRQLRAPDKNTVLRQKLQARKARAKLGLPRSQTNSLASRLFDVPQNIVSREQIEEQQTRQLIEQISRQTSQ